MKIIFILLAMIFCHILDDFFLQGMCLTNLKVKGWWTKNAPDENYKYDYIPALLVHAFSWTFMMMLPCAIYLKFDMGWLLIMYPINFVIHAIVDDLKANKRKINLIQDQCIHFAQIIATFGLFCLYVLV